MGKFQYIIKVTAFCYFFLKSFLNRYVNIHTTRVQKHEKTFMYANRIFSDIVVPVCTYE